MIKKIITLIVTISYITTCNGPCYGFGTKTLFARKSHAQRYVDDITAKDSKDILQTPSFLSIPKNFGRIVEYHKGNNEKLVIHIQDRHIDPVTQNNIASIIEILNVEHNIYLMCLEGASKELDTSFYNSFEDAALKKKIAEVFVQQGLFTGPELYKITNTENYMRAVGAEDSKLYLKHLASYKDNQVNKDSVVRLLKRMDNATDALKNHAYTKKLLAFDKVSRAYANKQVDLPEYLVQLKEYAAKANISLEEYANLSKFIRLTEKESKIDFKAAEGERESLIRYLSEHLPKEEVRELVRLSLDFRLNKVSDILFHEYLEALMNDNGLSNKDYVNLTAYIDYIRSSKAINHLQVFDEAQDLDNRVQLALCDNVTQEKTVEYARSISMLEDLYNLKLTHRNLDYMEEHPRSFDILKIASFLQRASSNYGLDVTIPVASLAAKKQSLEASREFYKLALKRDMALTDNTLRHMTRYKKDKAILVTGGFHTQGITNILKEKDISYVVICPTIGLEDCEKIYEERINSIIPDMDALKASLVHMLAVALNTGDIGDIAKREKVQERFAELYEVAPSLAGVDSALGKASSSGIRRRIAKGFVIAAMATTFAAMAGTGWYLQRASMRSHDAAMETFGIQQELPSDQWQIILDTLREIYALVKDVEAPKPRQMEMKFKVGKIARISRDYIMDNLDIIHKYAEEQGIEPNYLAAIILAEQMDIDEFSLKGEGTDKVGALYGYKTTKGPGQIKIKNDDPLWEKFKNVRWKTYANKTTDELSTEQLDNILYGGDIKNHILAIAIILREKRDSLKASHPLSAMQEKLQLGVLYTSTYRGFVNEDKEDFCTLGELQASALTQSQFHAKVAIILEKFMDEWGLYHKYKYVPEKLLLSPLTDSEKEAPAKSSSSGRKTMQLWESGHIVLPKDSQTELITGLGACFAVAAKNMNTGQRFMSHLEPIKGEKDSWKDEYINSVLPLDEIEGPDWSAIIIPSRAEYDSLPKGHRIVLDDIRTHLEKQNKVRVVRVKSDEDARVHKRVHFQADGTIEIVLPEDGGVSYKIDVLTKSSSAGTTVVRPLDNIPAEEIKNILVVGDYKKLFTEPKLGEAIIDLWPLVTSLCKKYPKAKIYVSAPYAGFYLAAHFNGQIVPLPSSISDVYQWGYDESKWLVKGLDGKEKLLYRAQDISATDLKTSNVRESFINNKDFFDTETGNKQHKAQEKRGVDMVFDVSVVPSLRFHFLGRADSIRPHLFNIESFLAHGNARNSSVTPKQPKPVTYYDKQGNAYSVDYGNALDNFFAVHELGPAGIWQATQAITNGLGFDNDSNELDYIKCSDEGKARAKYFIAQLQGVFDGKSEKHIFDTTKRIIVVNVYAQTQSNLMGANTQQKIDTWAEYINEIIQATRNTYIIFTRGGSMDPDTTFVESIVAAVQEKSSSHLRINENALILPKESLYPRINEIIGTADAVVTLDTGMSHYANAVFNKPTLLITSPDILHWSTPRDNVYFIERNLALEGIYGDSKEGVLHSIKAATILLNVLLDTESVLSILKSSKEEGVLVWLNLNGRMQQLKALLRKKHIGGADIFIDDSAQARFPAVVADFIERKAKQNAKDLWPIAEPIEVSSDGIKVLDTALCNRIDSATRLFFAPIDSEVSLFATRKRITLITDHYNFTKADKDQLSRLAKLKTETKYGSNSKIGIVLAYDDLYAENYERVKKFLIECGFSDTDIEIADDFSSLQDKKGRKWKGIPRAEQIAMIAASKQSSSEAIVTMTNEDTATGIRKTLSTEELLGSSVMGKVIVASMEGATRETEIGDYIIAKGDIMFSFLLSAAVNETNKILSNDTGAKFYAPLIFPLPPIDSDAFAQFINDLMDIKTAIEATASAA